MRCFITGIKGFVASYLVKVLKNRNYEIAGSYRKNDIDNLDDEVTLYETDLLNLKDLQIALKDYKPDIVFHMAAFSSVRDSWTNPELCLKVNKNGTENVLEAITTLDLHPKILFISSADVYGKPQQLPITEEHPVKPVSPYAESKLQAENVCLHYIQKYDYHILTARSFNHIGPKQSTGFVTSDFAKQIAQIVLKKQEPLIQVGNLDAKRDFTDVRDVVNAYVQIIEQCELPDIYNICSNKAIRIREILDIMLQYTNEEIDIMTDDAIYRPVEVQERYGSYKKLNNKTGWSPQISINETLQEIVHYWIKKLT